MTLPYRKKLIEVGLPLVAINAESAREKSIRHGHPSTLHLWWARRPLAACRAVLFASLVDDPDSDPVYRKADGRVDEDRAGIKRADLFNLIEELVIWENSNNPDVIRTARAEIARCVASRLIETGALKKDAVIGLNTSAYDLLTRGHCRPIPLGLDTKVGRVRFSFDVSRLPPTEVVNAFLAEHAPPMLDPFAGGGSIPLEAQRLGLRAYASDLNPVSVLINKALIEIPPKFAGRPPVNLESRGESSATQGKGKKSRTLIEKEWPGATGLAEDVRYYGQWMRDEAEKRIGHLYPKVEVTAEMAQDRPDLLTYVGQKLTVIAWLWARTVVSPNPAVNGAHVPLVRSYWLSTKKGKEVYVRPIVSRGSNSIRFQVNAGRPNNAFDPSTGTMNRNGGVYLLSGSPIPLEHIRMEGKAGRLGMKLLAIVADGPSKRMYLPPVDEHERLANETPSPVDVPDTDLPEAALGFRIQNYGMLKHRHLFTSRQLTALATFSDLVHAAHECLRHDAREADFPNDHKSFADGGHGVAAYADGVSTYLAFGVSRTSNTLCAFARWTADREQTVTAFSRQALPMTWDFPEVNPFAEAAGDIGVSISTIATTVATLPAQTPGIVTQMDARAVSTHGDMVEWH